jgi:hypothetical protein
MHDGDGDSIALRVINAGLAQFFAKQPYHKS